MMISGNPNHFLRWFSKLVCLSTLFLIFVGGLVTSTGSGLAVPDWPLSYGTLFPPMVGGVFYEHGHRMVAATVGFLMLILTLSLARWEKRRWVRILGWAALGTVIAQGVLGGITVLFFLPMPVSVSHGILAQTFFILTILIAYSQSQERLLREGEERKESSSFLRGALGLTALVYVQLIIGAIMRHTHSGLAIPDFPTMGGAWIPSFNETMLKTINSWRLDWDLGPVSLGQMGIHFAHRLWALVIAVFAVYLTGQTWKYDRGHTRMIKSILMMDALVAAQIVLGITTVLSRRAPYITSFHVMCGAATLGMSVLLVVRACPLKFQDFRNFLLMEKG